MLVAKPVSTRLPWFNMPSIPKELLEDMQNHKSISQRYYVAKIGEWSAFEGRPPCTIKKSIGEAGNLEAETYRILSSLNLNAD